MSLVVVLVGLCYLHWPGWEARRERILQPGSSVWDKSLEEEKKSLSILRRKNESEKQSFFNDSFPCNVNSKLAFLLQLP